MGKSAPKSPSPKKTAAAQTGTNIGTALAETALNTMNQVTPYGTLAYDITGTYTYTDPFTGMSYDIPKYTASQTFTPEGQKLLDTTISTQQNLADLANNQSSFLNDYMAKPFNYSMGDYENWAGNLYGQLTDSQNSQAQDALATRLSNQGIKSGSEAYDRAMQNLYTAQGNSRNKFMLDAYNTGINTALTERNQPINEITALMSGSQVSQPNFVNTPSTQIATTDVAGIINQDYQNKLAAYGQQQGMASDLMGGIFGLGASALMGPAAGLLGGSLLGSI